ncbi:MAG: cob(I)yrinic acid a,c-diamide adenosyltransferase [Phycisphaerae bacterium]|nr:cob(I)yrinic acid a,c-diamide adenosyltransferase [Phycisphaerae bacterium]
MLEKGLVQIYTGDGKGKTTAALGLAMRAAGRGNRVLFYQFLKPSSLQLGERTAIERLDNIELKAMEQAWDLRKSLHDASTTADVCRAVAETLKELTASATHRSYDVIILDEIVFCYAHKLAALDDIGTLVRTRDEHVEIVLTGRGADEPLMELADLVTEMKPIKHPFEKGITARKGIEY